MCRTEAAPLGAGMAALLAAECHWRGGVEPELGGALMQQAAVPERCQGGEGGKGATSEGTEGAGQGSAGHKGEQQRASDNKERDADSQQL